MKRDYKLIRRILLMMEEQEPGDEGLALSALADDGCDAATVICHAELMMDEGLVAEHRLVTGGSGTGVSLRLTSCGHDVLERIRDESFLERLLVEVRRQGLPLTLRVLTKVAESLLDKALP